MRSRWTHFRIAAALATFAALFATLTPYGHRIERLLPALGSRLVPEAPASGAVAVVAIDPDSLTAYGDGPWPHRRVAEVLDRLHRFKPRAVGVMLPLTHGETPAAIDTLRQQLDTLDKPLRNRAETWLAQLDTDARLAQSLHDAGTTVLAAPYRAADRLRPLPAPLERFTLETASPRLPWYRAAWRRFCSGTTRSDYEVEPPAELFLNNTDGVGLVAAFTHGERVPATPLAVETGDGRFLPGFELALLAAAKDPGSKSLQVNPDMAALHFGARRIGGAGFEYYPRPSVPPPVYALNAIMRSDTLARRLHNKTVLLGVSTTPPAPALTGPAGRSYTALTWSAQLLDSLHADSAFRMPDWFFGAQRGLLVLFGLVLVLLPPRWFTVRGTLAGGLVAAALLNAGLVTLVTRNLWLPVIAPALFLLLTQTLLSLARRRQQVLESAHRATVEARIALGANLQSQGQLDAAMEQFRICLPDAAALQALYELALEYERRRQVARALSAYEQIETYSRGFRDCAQRRERLGALSERFPTAGPAAAKATLVLDTPLMELPVLGRYRLERELGRGAMGTVYLATDPTIGRELAIKTLPIMDAYEEGEQAEVAARFFKEAEAVGRLDHPHIVSVHDAGREHDLAYIAMDYMPGNSLDAWTAKSGLLPVWEVLEIAAQVAEALAYAHGRKVVHRDIKPANILYDRDSGIAKITDFGVARILDASRTRSGTVLGTPSYMSPEQVAGKKTDGRSDLFSLGTTVYQLLTGSLPFEGESVAALMYRITNQKTPSIRKLRRGLPVCVARLVAKALQKEPAKRFADGEAMAAALLACRAQFKGGRRKTA